MRYKTKYLKKKDPQKQSQANLMLKVTDLANEVRSKVWQIQEKRRWNSKQISK